jgi:hypothetical protein
MVGDGWTIGVSYSSFTHTVKLVMELSRSLFVNLHPLSVFFQNFVEDERTPCLAFLSRVG